MIDGAGADAYRHRFTSKLNEAVRPCCAPPSGALLPRSGERIALLGSPLGLPWWCIRLRQVSAVRSPGVRSADGTPIAFRSFSLRSGRSGRLGRGPARSDCWAKFRVCLSAPLTALERMTLQPQPGFMASHPFGRPPALRDGLVFGHEFLRGVCECPF
jgi:hypothetical protein